MLKIATHDSATGEKAKNFLSFLVIPFSRTQSKTIIEQYIHGCRLFDIRVRKIGKVYHCAHGLFVTKKTTEQILEELSDISAKDGEEIRVYITYEGSLDCYETETFKNDVLVWQRKYNNLVFGPTCVKYSKSKLFVKYAKMLDGNEVPTEQAFLPLDGKTWQTYIPIPWLWKKIYFNTPTFNQDVYKFVDFL